MAEGQSQSGVAEVTGAPALRDLVRRCCWPCWGGIVGVTGYGGGLGSLSLMPPPLGARGASGVYVEMVLQKDPKWDCAPVAPEDSWGVVCAGGTCVPTLARWHRLVAVTLIFLSSRGRSGREYTGTERAGQRRPVTGPRTGRLHESRRDLRSEARSPGSLPSEPMWLPGKRVTSPPGASRESGQRPDTRCPSDTSGRRSAPIPRRGRVLAASPGAGRGSVSKCGRTRPHGSAGCAALPPGASGSGASDLAAGSWRACVREEGASTFRFIPSVSGWGCSACPYGPRDPSGLVGPVRSPRRTSLAGHSPAVPTLGRLRALPPTQHAQGDDAHPAGRTAPLQTHSASTRASACGGVRRRPGLTEPRPVPVAPLSPTARQAPHG